MQAERLEELWLPALEIELGRVRLHARELASAVRSKQAREETL